MDVKYLGHSSFKLSFKSANVVTDPFDKGSVGLNFPKTEAQIVTISHSHDDHNKKDAIDGVKKVVDGPGEYEIEGVSILGIPSYHDDKKGAERGPNTIYVFEADDLRVVHLGDLGHTLEEKTLEKIGDVDVLMIPVGGVYTVDASKAAEVARSIEADILIPMHYKVEGMSATFKDMSGVDDFVKEMGIKAARESKLKVKKEDLMAEEQQIVILESK